MKKSLIAFFTHKKKVMAVQSWGNQPKLFQDQGQVISPKSPAKGPFHEKWSWGWKIESLFSCPKLLFYWSIIFRLSKTEKENCVKAIWWLWAGISRTPIFITLKRRKQILLWSSSNNGLFKLKTSSKTIYDMFSAHVIRKKWYFTHRFQLYLNIKDFCAGKCSYVTHVTITDIYICWIKNITLRNIRSLIKS